MKYLLLALLLSACSTTNYNFNMFVGPADSTTATQTQVEQVQDLKLSPELANMIDKLSKVKITLPAPACPLNRELRDLGRD